MKLQERYSLATLGNRSQEIVFDAIGRLIDDGADMCTCEECVTDLAAWTLNHVTPRYYTSLLTPLSPDPGRERQTRVQVELALAAGLKRLKQHPHHG
jgi:competence protein ComFB